jgi:hypothetical protein
MDIYDAFELGMKATAGQNAAQCGCTYSGGCVAQCGCTQTVAQCACSSS